MILIIGGAFQGKSAFAKSLADGCGGQVFAGVHQYIRQKRLQKAAEDIRRGVPVLKAAEEAGFGDYSVFLRAFREAYGRSPREWK